MTLTLSLISQDEKVVLLSRNQIFGSGNRVSYSGNRVPRFGILVPHSGNVVPTVRVHALEVISVVKNRFNLTVP